jgi:hypothetical protein
MAPDPDDRQLDLFCLRWAAWCRTRRFLGAPRVPPSILARMQPGRVREAPDAEMSAELSAFNTAVSAQPDSPAKVSFLLFYLHPARSVKEAAFAQGITRDAFYRRVRRFRRHAYRSAIALTTSLPFTREFSDAPDGPWQQKGGPEDPPPLTSSLRHPAV